MRFPQRLFLFVSVLTIVFTTSTITPSQATCPLQAPGSHFYFKGGSTIKYSYDYEFGTSRTTERDAIEAAITLWNLENFTNNCSRITFTPAVYEFDVDLYFESGVPNNASAVAEFLPLSWSGGYAQSARIVFNFGLTVGGLKIWDPAKPNYALFAKKIALHELGHSLGLRDSQGNSTACTSNTPGASVMNGVCNPNDNGTPSVPATVPNGVIATAPTACDNGYMTWHICPTPTPEPTPYPTPPDGCLDPIDNFNQGSCPLYFSEDSTGYYCCSVGCSYEAEEQVWDPSGYGELDCGVCQDGIDNDCGDGGADDQDYDCGDCWPSPILIDTRGDGFDMSGVANGVDFDIRGVGRPIRVSWSQGDDVWLALDRNGNGRIDSGKELFGNFTYQLSSPERNGFRALSVYDETANGGNADGVINAQDAIFQSLRLWLDSNRNGISEPSELFGLASKNVAEIELDYKLSQRTDGKGNRFRYRAKIKSADGSQLGRWAWDVFLSTESSSGSSANALLIQPFQYYQPIRSTRPACGLKTRA